MQETQLARRLGLTSAIMITVGAVIGSGIFMKPLEVSQSLPTELSIYLVWAGLGVVCLFGAFAYAELGGMFPEAGGQYAFLREAWGRFPAFLYGWTFALVINSGTMAALAVAFATNIDHLTPLGDSMQLIVATAMVLLLAVVNHFGVSWGAILQNVSTFAKLAALVVIVVGGCMVVGGAPPGAVDVPRQSQPTLGFITAFVAIFWAYEGWYQLPYNAAELKRPERDLRRGLIWGMVILIVLYIVVNAVYLHVVPLDEMRAITKDRDVPLRVVDRVFGGNAGAILALLVCLSVFGAANPNLLSSPRAFYAMAKDGLMWRRMMTVHPVHRTPTVAIWTQAAWGILLIWVFAKFKDITEFVVFAALLFYALTVAGVYVLRVRMPNAVRSYRCTGFPVTPALFIATVLFVDVTMLTEPAQQTNALIGLAIIASGVPVYYLMRKLYPTPLAPPQR